MLKHLKLGLIAFICLGSFVVKAQKVIPQGSITYAVQFELPPDQQAMAAMLPSEYKVFFKGDMSKFKLDMGMFSTEVIYNAATNETLSLTDVPMQGKKMAVKMNSDQTKKMSEIQTGEKEYEATVTTETKTIAGYKCAKYVVKDKISGDVMDVWTTTDISVPKNSLTSALKLVKGVPVEFSGKSNGINTKMNLKEIKEEPVKDIALTIPDGYETLTFDQLLQMMGQ